MAKLPSEPIASIFIIRKKPYNVKDYRIKKGVKLWKKIKTEEIFFQERT